MNPSKRGLSSAAKAGAVVIAIVVVLGAAYFLPGLYGGGSQATTATGPVSTVKGIQTVGVYSLIKVFSKMTLVVDTNDVVNGIVNNDTYTYSVLGKSPLTTTDTTVNGNSTSTTTVSGTYTRVEFTTSGIGGDVIMWFNSTGGVARVDVLGLRNYTGSGVPLLPYVTTYVNLFGAIPTVTNNATLLSLLTKTSETTTSIGPTQAVVTSYSLQSSNAEYSTFTLRLALIPSKNVELAVYAFGELHDKSYTLIQVTSLTG